MSMHRPDIGQIQQAVVTSLHEHWLLFLVEGIILAILGLAAIVIPPIATLAVEILIGWLFLISGIAGLITTLWMREAPGFWWSLVSALLGREGQYSRRARRIRSGRVLLTQARRAVVHLCFRSHRRRDGSSAENKRRGKGDHRPGEQRRMSFQSPIPFEGGITAEIPLSL